MISKHFFRQAIIMIGCFTLSFFMSGCTSTPKNQSIIALPKIQLSPASMGQNISLQQQLHVFQNGQSHHLDIILEIDAQKISLVGLSLGQRVLSFDYDGKLLNSWRHLMLPKEVQAENVLQNLQLAFWPKNIIQQALPAGWTIKDDPLYRTIFYEDVKMINIRYTNPVRWIDTIVFQDFHYHYLLTIQSVSTSS